MEDGFELLEEKVKKAADLVRRLRRENKDLEGDLAKIKPRLQEAEKKPAGAPPKQTQDAAKAGDDTGGTKPAGDGTAKDGAAKLDVPVFDLKSMVKDFPAIQAALAG